MSELLRIGLPHRVFSRSSAEASVPPILDLSDASPGRAYIRLLAVMYAPDDLKLHREFESSMYARGVIETAAPLARESEADLQERGIDPRRLLKMLADAAQAPGLTHIQRKMAAAGLRRGGLIKGVIAGLVLGGVLQPRGVLQTRGTIATVMREMSRLAGEARLSGCSEGAMRRDWEAFRDVSHIWLGHLMAVGGPRQLVTSAELLEILGRADDYRRQGEAYTTGNRAVPLLDPASVWRFLLPAGVELPEPA